ncbi:MAG TPA: TPM domain-containing protein [Candidatus Saccharimonadales bacterium]|nr:TPM domain-containing protein [Candidatus Saccharimonadales bacterium]
MRWRVKSGIVQLLLLLLAAFAYAEPVSQLHATGYVNDFAHVLQPNTVARMEGICQQVDQKAHAQIAVVTINSLDGVDVESYAVNLYKSWGIGDKSSNRGVLILYAIRDHRARIEVGYGLEPILPDGKVGGFQREAIPLMRSGDYSAALLLVTNRVSGVIAQDAGVQIANLPTPAARYRSDNPDGQQFSLGGIILFLIILAVVLFTPLRGLLFWLLLSQLGGGRGSGGGWGGGGFGGGGGGGGFGGFGGGSSGGGGASSSW